MEKENDTVEALVVHDSRIIFAGSAEIALGFGAKTLVDLKGAAVIPGFNDTHCHISEMAETPLKVDLLAAESIDEVVALLTAKKSGLEPGAWIVGYNLEGGKLREKRLPDRYDLDRVSQEIPVFVSEIGLHDFMCSSGVLETAGISKGFDKPWHELLELDAGGEPTGRIKEHGMLRYINARRPIIFGTREKALDALENALLTCAQWGYTTLHTYDGFSGSMLDSFSAYQALEKEQRLPMRMVLNRTGGDENELGAVSGFGNEKIKYGAVKFFADGSYAQHSAYLLAPYVDMPETCGRLIHRPEDLKAGMKKAYEDGNDVAVHVIGDGAAELVIRIIEEISQPESPAVFTMIHCHLLNDGLRKRMAKLPVIAAMQPIFVGNLSTATVHEKIGRERVKNYHAFGSALKSGVTVTGGTDGPISNQNPMLGIAKAVSRIDCFGEPFQPQEKVSVFDAVGFYAKNAARCAHEETLKGTLTDGKLADFIVLDRDIFQIDPADIEHVRVTATYLGGERTF